MTRIEPGSSVGPESTIKVGANLLWLVPGVVGGSEEYTVRMLESLARLAQHRVALTLFVNRRLYEAHPDLVDAFPAVVAPVGGSSRGARVVAEATWLARQARAEGLDLMHHLGGTMPILRGTPGVVTIHDLQPFAFPEHFSLVKRAYLRATVPMSVRRAVAVIVLTEWTRADVVERMGIDPERVLLVPPGLDPPVPADPLVGREVRTRYGLADAPFFLYPAITYAHKNHLTLVRAFAAVAERDDRVDARAHRGRGRRRGGPAVRDLEARPGRPGAAHRARPRRDLDALFSRGPGTNVPVALRRLRHPRPRSHEPRRPGDRFDGAARCPEVVGDGGLLIDPDDVDAWSDGHVADAARRRPPRRPDRPGLDPGGQLHVGRLAPMPSSGPTTRRWP